ncbi:MAG: tRNA (cytidine(56)-2'-O)-methyltransferase [Euryarchaeota archaeon]|nr:tRNA (cytidine(56)-2'-O)-methyltransferase [Euryarchaeota archaeon]MDE1835937.1 tRNA (cytidine(56)-2'-O)-methyltransferase [Euryarchaeota archaeon]MDE1880609.1 tRNA (cytidine(56)-2'-O)-methyltransferase [Euryarchaeota archaeon]MDE2044385.1 tRNA (cytidine(56)-2'-O)-methyltransferase [Thermoplasmata archaeon]
MGEGDRRPRVEVLRLGHRPSRDPRLTTHLALTARAFGAGAIHVEPPDLSLAERVRSATERFGGEFRVEGVRAWRPFLKGWAGTTVHLTMYGEDLDEVAPRLKVAPGPFLVIVGGPKVPREVYELSTFNVAVTHQPHSEVAALALTLDRLLGTPREELRPRARLQVLPHPRGKKVVDHEGRAVDGSSADTEDLEDEPAPPPALGSP